MSPKEHRPSSSSSPASGAPARARGSLPADRRIDVQLIDTPDGRREIVLRELSWGPGVGWYTQRSLRLDSQQVDALMGALCCARQELSSSQRGSGICPRDRLVPPPQRLDLSAPTPEDLKILSLAAARSSETAG